MRLAIDEISVEKKMATARFMSREMREELRWQNRKRWHLLREEDLVIVEVKDEAVVETTDQPPILLPKPEVMEAILELITRDPKNALTVYKLAVKQEKEDILHLLVCAVGELLGTVDFPYQIEMEFRAKSVICRHAQKIAQDILFAKRAARAARDH